MKEVAVILKCCNCGSTRIRRDAWAEFDPDIDSWVLGGTFDEDVWCADCGKSGWDNITEERY